MPTTWMRPIIAVNEPAPMMKLLSARRSMNGASDRDGGLARRNHRTMIQIQQTTMPPESQNGKAPPPGPVSGFQPIGSSVLFHMRIREKTVSTTAMVNSATRIPVFPLTRLLA